MLENPIWNLLIKIFSFFAVILLLLSAGLTVAQHFGWTQNQFAGVLTVIFAVIFSVFSLVAVNFSNFKLSRELRAAAEVVHDIAQGELLDEDFESRSEIFDSLKDVSAYLRDKAASAERIGNGDLSKDIQLCSDSDVLGRSFQNMTEKLRVFVESKEKRDLLQKTIAKLSENFEAAAAGDLTVRAEVSPEMTGALAATFNRMIKNLNSLIKQVRDVTFQMSSSTCEISDATEKLARGSESQGAQISRTTTAISNMTLQIQGVSENAALSAKVAGDSLGNARYGKKVVQDNINAMNAIRKQVKETARRIKRLGERSQEISQIVQLIEDLSDRTGLLALNASLQASANDQARAGFAAHAEEVERLAERSNRLTQQIAALTQSIQTETKDVVASMEETIHEVVVGSALADKAGQALVEIEQVSTHLAELTKSISASTREQAAGAEDIIKAMTNISDVTELVQTGARRASGSVKILVELSDELHNKVAPFKLPEDRNTEKAPVSDALNLFVN